MRFLVAGILSLALLTTASAQSPKSFEVAAIRPTQGDQNAPTSLNVYDGGLLRMANATARFLLLATFRTQKDQIAGGPSWLDTDRFDIEARTGRPEKIAQSQIQPLMQDLLEQRFHLKVHRETRDLTVNILALDKDGPKMKASAEGAPSDMNMSRGPGKTTLTGTGVSMKSLAAYLGLSLGRIVVDQTGLDDTHAYDIKLEWAPDGSDDPSTPSLFTALREQLGLRLNAGKAPVEMLVIDGVEKPSEN